MPRCPLAEESRQEMWCQKVHVKKNETIPFSREWVQLGIIMIKKRMQTVVARRMTAR